MRPEDYVFGLGPVMDLDELERIALRLLPGDMLGGACAGTSPAPVKPIATATRLKGEPIMETRRVEVGRKPGNVLLELTPEAAEVLAGFIGDCVTGPDSGPRGVLTRVFHTLTGSGINSRARRFNYAGKLFLTH